MRAQRVPFTAAVTEHGGLAALMSLALAAWLLVAFAQFARFNLWPLALIPAGAALALGVWCWLRSDWFDRLASLGLIALAALLYAPPAQHLALSGDAAIYPNEAYFLQRTGGLRGVHGALAALSPATRDLFTISSDEQFGGKVVVQAYDGLVYGGYYVADAGTATVESSRMPQTIAWMALASALVGAPAVYWVNLLAAALSLICLYALASQALGRVRADRWIALWSTVLLAICYAQIYLARQPLAEITGQLWTLAGFYAAILWLRRPRPLLLLAALFFWVTAWSARLDAILLLGPAGLLLIVAAHDRERASLRVAALAALPLLLLAWLGNNPAYTSSTRQLVFAIYDALTPVVIVLALVGVLGLAAAWIWGARATHRARGAPARVAGWLLFALAAFVIAWSTLPNPLREAGVTRHWQEIPWFSSLYLSPMLYWLALTGFGLTLWRGGDRAQVFLIASWLGLGAAYFYTYTTAPVYPIALRRLASDLLPLSAALAGLALAKLPPRQPQPWRAWVQAGVAVVALGWVAWLASPLLEQHEAPHDLSFVQSLHEALPPGAAVIFEPQDADSWIGWLAAPLFSRYGDWSLLLESDTPDPALLAQAVDELQQQGRTVLVATQWASLPAALHPAHQDATAYQQLTWSSALIGQTRAPYPPAYWQYQLPLNLFALTPAAP